MPFDPALPAANSPVSSAELRNQFNGLKALIDSVPQGATVDQLNDAVNMLSQDIAGVQSNVDAQIATTALNPVEVSPIGFAVSDPPTRAEMQQVVDKLNELIGALQRS